MDRQNITFDNKENLTEEQSIPDKNKIKAEDINQIKNVVNNNSEIMVTVKEISDEDLANYL